MKTLFIFLWFWLCPVAEATTLFYLDDIQQAELSDAVVVARIGTAQTSPHPDYPTIMTETTIIIEEILLGHAPSELKIRQIGGRYQGKTLFVPGDAQFKYNERVVLFLNEKNGHWYLTALGQSKYSLVSQSRKGWVLSQSLGDGFVQRAPSGELVPYTPPQKPPEPLTRFRARMRSLRGGQ